MSDIDKQDLNSEAIPFFARFLEGQFGENLSEEEMEAVRGGERARTDVYPVEPDGGIGSSPGGGIGSLDIPIPSIQELLDQFSGGAVTTLKYPSDQEDQ